MRSRYGLVHAEKSYCPRCNRTATLLCPSDGTHPMFYICWKCEWIGEVGVGPVEVHSDVEDREKLI